MLRTGSEYSTPVPRTVQYEHSHARQPSPDEASRGVARCDNGAAPSRLHAVERGRGFSRTGHRSGRVHLYTPRKSSSMGKPILYSVLQDWTVRTVQYCTRNMSLRTEEESRLSCRHSDAGGRGACRDDSRETKH